MKRRWFTVGGVVEIAIAVGATALLPDVVLTVPAFAFLIATFLVSGLLAVLAGEGRTVAGLEWRQLLGLSYVTFALGLMSYQVWSAVTHPGDLGAVVTAAGILFGGFLILFMGVDLIRGPKHFDLSNVEPGPIFGSRSQ